MMPHASPTPPRLRALHYAADADAADAAAADIYRMTPTANIASRFSPARADAYDAAPLQSCAPRWRA